MSDDGRILFYKRDRKKYRFLSNFFYAPFRLEGQLWPTVEHFYVAHKSEDPHFTELVLEEQLPSVVKKMGSYFDMIETGFVLRPDWDRVRIPLMDSAVTEKFKQNPFLLKGLIATGNKELVEDSPSDYFWGSGADGEGENWLGSILMKVRGDLNEHYRKIWCVVG